MINDRYKYPELQRKHERMLQKIQQMTDQEVLGIYSREMLKLKLLNRFGRHSEHFQGYPNTFLMNRSRRIIASRKLSFPRITQPEPGGNAMGKTPRD